MPTRLQDDMMKHPFLDEIEIGLNDCETTGTLENILSWSIYESEKGIKMGIIRLSSFTPVGGPAQTINLIRNLIVNELVETDCLLIDVRNNGGGLISLAEGLPQLFSKSFQKSSARALITPINEKMFSLNDYQFDWGPAYTGSSPGSMYTNLVSFTSDEAATNMGQAYLKPVGVLNNGNCYSACDLFSALMQDSEAATIFSHDGKSGGGGANVIEFNSYLVTKLPSVFTRLPGGQDMRVAWRETLRPGKKFGSRIEDVGVTADFIVRPQVKDFNPYATTFTYFETIAEKLIEIGKESDSLDLNFVAEPQIQGDSIIGTHVEFQCQLSNIDRLELVLEDDTLVGISTLIASTKLESITLSTFDKIIDASLHSYRIMGYRNKKRVLVTKRLIRYVPANENYLSLEQGTSTVWDFAFNGYTGLYTRFNQIGWSRNGNAVVLDNGQTFSKSADTTLSFFLNVPAADNPAPGCVQNYKFWRDNNEEESWSSIDKIFFNTTIEMVYILDDETLIGVYYDLAREWLATWLNRANGSPASETVVQAFVNCKEILQENQHDALNFRLGEHKDGSDSNQILSTLYAYNNGNDVKINGDPLACTLNPAFYIRAEYDTRKSIDVLRIVVKANGKDKKELKSVSGAGIIDETFYLDGFADERIEIDIRFTSEHGQVSSGRGIIIRRVVFSA